MIDFIRRLFRQPSEEKLAPLSDVQTAPLSEDQLEVTSIPTINWTPPQLLVGCAQSVGMQRDHNEDSMFTMTAEVADGHSSLPFGLFMVADGMGGHSHGDIASQTATRALSEYLIRKIYLPMLDYDPDIQNESLQEVLEAGIKHAHQAVVQRAPGGGTTMTAALVLSEQVTIAHVGDSRAYFIYPDGRSQTLTQDHSLVHRLIELGQLTEAEALVHPQRNVVYRALGQAEPFHPDIKTLLLPHPGYLMICSDGLWGVVPEDVVCNTILSASRLSEACHQLVELANKNGGPDNISVILVQYL